MHLSKTSVRDCSLMANDGTAQQLAAAMLKFAEEYKPLWHRGSLTFKPTMKAAIHDHKLDLLLGLLILQSLIDSFGKLELFRYQDIDRRNDQKDFVR